MSYTQHPLSAAFPEMSVEDFAGLKDSIEHNGVLNPITIYEGMVIDGWHRYRAANDLGIECPSVELEEVDPRDFVLAQNKARRHITSAQLAIATTAVYAWKPVGANQHEKREDIQWPPSKSNDELALIAGVHKNTIKQAKAVQAQAAPEVLEAVKRGDIGLPKASAIAKLPKDQQAEAINKPAPKSKPKAEEQPIQEDTSEKDELRQAVDILSEENDRLNDRLAVEAMDATEEEKTSAANTIAELRARVKTLEAELSAVKASRDTYMRESAEKQKQIAYWRKQAEKVSA